MSILNVKTSDLNAGIKKTIDKNSNDVALDILQRGIYAYPAKSTIRELTSNSYDAVMERETSKKILDGSEKVEDHYDIEKIDGIYHASGWDPDYYNIDYLSTDNNIYLFYDEGVQKDVLRIKDSGIGLGKDRLVGYFQLAYSSKRSQKGALGKWGLGNKSALSLGIDSYTVINRYNGKKFRFEVYLNDVISTTPKFSGGKMNNHIIVSVPQMTETGELVDKEFIFYYEDTKEFNGLELIVPVKKTDKKEFFRAIEEQLMYIPNVVFNHKEKGNISYNIIDIAAKVLYKDNNIVISESTLLNYPHILLGTGNGLINYGAIDFEALELEPKRGAVGLILDINEVEVTPSREAVIWSPRTRKAVIDSYNKIVNTATILINKELNSAVDYWEWIQKAGSIKNALVNNLNSDGGSVLQKLSGIIDASTINKIYYQKNNMNKLYTSDVKSVIGDRLLIRIFSYDSYAKKIKRVKIKSVNAVSGYTAYVTDGNSDKYKDRYIYEQLAKGDFLVIKRLEQWAIEKTSNLIGNSPLLEPYDGIVVPEDVMDLYLKEEVDGNSFDDDESANVTIDPNRLAKLRKLEQEILFHQARADQSNIVFSSTTVKIKDILADYKNQQVIYGNFSERSLIEHTLGLFPFKMFKVISSHISRNSDTMDIFNEILSKKDLSTVNAILISRDNIKHIADKNNFHHISEFIIEDYKDGKITINKNLRFVLTFVYISKIIRKYNITFPNLNLLKEDSMKNFYVEEFVNALTVSEVFKSSVSTYIPAFFEYAVSYEMGKGNLDDMTLQDYLNAMDKALPEELCTIVDEITDIHIVDVNIINKVEEYCKFYSKYNPILKEINYDTDIDIMEVLYPLVENYEKFPKEIQYF